MLLIFQLKTNKVSWNYVKIKEQLFLLLSCGNINIATGHNQETQKANKWTDVLNWPLSQQDSENPSR